MSNLTVYGGGGTLSRLPNAGRAIGALGPYIGAAVTNIVKGGATERAVSRGIEAAAGDLAATIAPEVVRKIGEDMINNPQVMNEIARALGPFFAKQLTDAALGWLDIQYKKHYYSVWAIIYITALLTIRVVDLIITRGRITNAGTSLGIKSISKSAHIAIKSARAVALAIRRLKNPRSANKKTQVLILFIFMFGLIMSTSRPIAGSFISMAGPYLANRASPNRASPNRASPNRASPNRASPNRASPRRASPNRASPRRASPNRGNTGRVVSLAGSTHANNASRRQARGARFGVMTNAQRMMGRLARFGPAN
jgi:hypothetical protein